MFGHNNLILEEERYTKVMSKLAKEIIDYAEKAEKIRKNGGDKKVYDALEDKIDKLAIRLNKYAEHLFGITAHATQKNKLTYEEANLVEDVLKKLHVLLYSWQNGKKLGYIKAGKANEEIIKLAKEIIHDCRKLSVVEEKLRKANYKFVKW